MNKIWWTPEERELVKSEFLTLTGADDERLRIAQLVLPNDRHRPFKTKQQVKTELDRLFNREPEPVGAAGSGQPAVELENNLFGHLANLFSVIARKPPTLSEARAVLASLTQEVKDGKFRFDRPEV